MFKSIFLSILVLFGLNSIAATMVANAPDGSIFVSDKPCTNKVILEKNKIPDLLEAQVTLKKEQFKACWHPLQGGVHLLYEDGDEGLIPFSMFKPQQEV